MALLQIYQLNEFLICIGVNINITGRIAFTAITFLPPSGHYLISKNVNWKYKDYLLWFGLGFIFALYYIFTPDAVELVNCNPFYAMYEYKIATLYGWYYLGNILHSLILLIVFLSRKLTVGIKKKAALLLFGYALLLIPVGIMVYLVDPIYGGAVPSIMCKYAIFLAVVLFIFSFQYEKK